MSGLDLKLGRLCSVGTLKTNPKVEALDLTTRTRDLSLRELPPLLDPKSVVHDT